MVTETLLRFLSWHIEIHPGPIIIWFALNAVFAVLCFLRYGLSSRKMLKTLDAKTPALAKQLRVSKKAYTEFLLDTEIDDQEIELFRFVAAKSLKSGTNLFLYVVVSGVHVATLWLISQRW